jgi:plasmid maintenance system antidote protein VapI
MKRSLAEILRDAIKRSNLSLGELARRADLNKPTLSRFINGKRDLSLRLATRLAHFLGLELRPMKPIKKRPTGRTH